MKKKIYDSEIAESALSVVQGAFLKTALNSIRSEVLYCQHNINPVEMLRAEMNYADRLFVTRQISLEEWNKKQYRAIRHYRESLTK